MYWFLAIVKKEDGKHGNFLPYYVLCKSKGTSENRSGLRVVKYGSSLYKMNRALVTDINRNNHLIDFMSNYRTRDHMHGSKHYRHKSTMKYYPQGYLCWFPCNAYGEQIGPPLFVKTVPDPPKGSNTDDGFQNLKEFMEYRPTVSELVTEDPSFETISTVKPTFAQPYKKIHVYSLIKRKQKNGN